MIKFLPAFVLSLLLLCFCIANADEIDTDLMNLIDGKKFELILNHQDYEITFRVSFPEEQRGIALMKWASWDGNVRLNHSQIYYFEVAGGIVTLEGIDLMLGFDGKLIVLCPEYIELIPID